MSQVSSTIGSAPKNDTSQELETRTQVEHPAISPWHKIAEDVRRDSQDDASEYLEQSVVPFGGE